MEYKLTQHAKDALQKRRISLEWMEQVLHHPEWTESDSIDENLQHRLGRIADRDNRALRVIVNLNPRPPRIVTVYFDRRRKEK